MSSSGISQSHLSLEQTPVDPMSARIKFKEWIKSHRVYLMLIAGCLLTCVGGAFIGFIVYDGAASGITWSGYRYGPCTDNVLNWNKKNIFY